MGNGWERIHFEYVKFEISKHQVEMSNKQLYVQVCINTDIILIFPPMSSDMILIFT